MGKERWTKLQRRIRSITERYTIYVLECESGKYYVGSTQNKKKRFHQHFVVGRASVWTRKYKPIKILRQYKRIPAAYALGLESKVTAQAMVEYGVNRVRGAMWCNAHNYTLKELDPLTRFLGHYNDLSYSEVREALREELPAFESRKRSCSRARKKSSILTSINATPLQGAQNVTGTEAASGKSSVEEKIADSNIAWNVDEFVFKRRRNGFQTRVNPSDRCYRCGKLGKTTLKTVVLRNSKNLYEFSHSLVTDLGSTQGIGQLTVPFEHIKK